MVADFAHLGPLEKLARNVVREKVFAGIGFLDLWEIFVPFVFFDKVLIVLQVYCIFVLGADSCEKCIYEKYVQVRASLAFSMVRLSSSS